jgi:hypothetical protein
MLMFVYLVWFFKVLNRIMKKVPACSFACIYIIGIKRDFMKG